MNNIVFVKTPTFIVNANGRLSESLRADETKGQRKLTVETRNFDSLKAALSWVNKEGQKKSTVLYLYEVRPAAHGSYNVRFNVNSVKPVAKKPVETAKTNSTNNNAKTVATSTTNNVKPVTNNRRATAKK
jgi:hypothetical protein